MKKLASLVAALALVPVLFASAPVFADSPGQLSNGPTNYKVRNVTKNGSYAQSVAAACGDTVKYSVILSNSDFGQLTNLTLKANLSSGAISASAQNTVGNTTTASGTATVTTSGTLEYVPGSTVRIASDAVTKTPLADGVATASGVNVGTLAGSTQIFVQFEAKVKCTAPSTIKVCDLTTKQVVTINESDFDSAKHTKDMSKCNAQPQPVSTTTTELTKTGPGDVAALFAVVAMAGAVAYNWVLRRQS